MELFAAHPDQPPAAALRAAARRLAALRAAARQRLRRYAPARAAARAKHFLKHAAEPESTVQRASQSSYLTV